MITAEILYIDFPEEIKGIVSGMTRLKNDGNYLIAIDSALSESEQIKTREHELAHIFLDHFHADELPLSDLENQADLLAAQRIS